MIFPTEACPVHGHIESTVSYSCAAEFALRGSNGYRITVSADAEGRSDEVQLSAEGYFGTVQYSAPGKVTATTIKASFSHLGRVSVSTAAPASPAPGLPAPQDLPPNAVAVVLHPPATLRTITTHDFHRALAQAAAQAGRKRAPKRGQNGYRRLQLSAMANLLDRSWIEGQAAEMGLAFTPHQIATEVAQIKRQNFKSAAQYRKFLHHSHYTQHDVHELIKLEMLSTAIQQRVLQGIKGKRAQRRALTSFIAEYTNRWRSRTVCAPGYVFARCSKRTPFAKGMNNHSDAPPAGVPPLRISSTEMHRVVTEPDIRT